MRGKPVSELPMPGEYLLAFLSSYTGQSMYWFAFDDYWLHYIWLVEI